MRRIKHNKYLDRIKNYSIFLFVINHLYSVIIAYFETGEAGAAAGTFFFWVFAEIYWIIKLFGENDIYVYISSFSLIMFFLSYFFINFEKVSDKYKTLIKLILERSGTYQLKEIRDNVVQIEDRLIQFKISEIEGKLIIDWEWTTWVGKTHSLNWKFKNDELDDQVSIYNKIDNDLAVQNLIDDGWPKEPAIDHMRIKNCKDEKKKEILSIQFNKKYPNFFEEMIKEIEKKQKNKF